MRPVSDDEINRYIATGKPLDKAGAYGIQDDECDFVDKIKGQLETVIGLPQKLSNNNYCLADFLN